MATPVSRRLFRLWLIVSLCWVMGSAGWLGYELYDATSAAVRSFIDPRQCERLAISSDIESCRQAVQSHRSVTIADLIFSAFSKTGTWLIVLGLLFVPVGGLGIGLALVAWLGRGTD